MLSHVGVGGGLASVLDTQFLFIKENWIYTMNRHHGNNLLLARNLPFNSDVRWWSHPLMIPMHCFWAKSNNRMSGQFEYGFTLLFFLFFFCLISFVFVWFHWFTCTVQLLPHSLFAFSSYANKIGWFQNEH